jgi:hypothetical protein
MKSAKVTEATHSRAISITPVRTMLPADSRSRDASRTRIDSIPNVENHANKLKYAKTALNSPNSSLPRYRASSEVATAENPMEIARPPITTMVLVRTWVLSGRLGAGEEADDISGDAFEGNALNL